MRSYFIEKMKRKYRKLKAWRKYGNHTKFHFMDNPSIIVDGELTHGVPQVEIYDDTAKLHIGKYCSIAADCKIILGGNHHTKWASTYAFYQEPKTFPSFSGLGLADSIKHGNVEIGNDVWIGRGVMILSGSQIGDGAVVGGGQRSSR